MFNCFVKNLAYIQYSVSYHDNSYRVVSEIDEVLEGKETVSLGDLDKLAYTTAVSMTSLLLQKL